MRLRVKIYSILSDLWMNWVYRLKERLKPIELRRIEQQCVSSRVIEYAFIIKNLIKLKKGKIVDVGFGDGLLMTSLATLGHRIFGIDIRLCLLRYPNTALLRGSICKAPYQDNSFDAVIAVSTIEHLGIKEAYGDLKDPKADKIAVTEMARILKPNGKMLITLPYGKGGSPHWRIYNDYTLKQLLSGLRIEVAEYFARKRGSWLPISQVEAEKIISPHIVNAIVLLVLSKHFDEPLKH